VPANGTDYLPMGLSPFEHGSTDNLGIVPRLAPPFGHLFKGVFRFLFDWQVGKGTIR
jgi:hypothetical protein